MAGQFPLLQRLIELLREVEQFSTDEQGAERQAAVKRVEAEIDTIEANMAAAENVDPTVASQGAALISVVRAALKSDQEEQDGAAPADWSDEGLMKAHGFVSYATSAYWDEAYAEHKYGDSYDWYGAWAERDVEGRTLGELVRPLLSKEGRLLMLGCGNSNMSVSMHKEGFLHIDNVDVAEAVIEQMRRQHGEIEGLAWHRMDASALDFPQGAFDTAIEKGLLDALFAGTAKLVAPVMAEALRVLRPGGRLVSISFSATRLEDLKGRAVAEASPETANAIGAFSCHLAGQLRYGKVRDSKEGQDKQHFYVYACDTPTS